MNIVNKKAKFGFTLLELGIALAVITLLSIAVSKGSELINYSKSQVIIKEQYEIRLAINNFREKFNALPGDIQDAHETLGSVFTGNGDDFISSQPKTLLPNNPAFGLFPHINQINQNPVMNGPYESVSTWEHLQKAGLLNFKQNFSGLTRHDPLTTYIMPDVPKSSIHKDERYAYFISNAQRPELTNNSLISKQFHLLEFANFREFDENTLQGLNGALPSKLAFYIDNKIDDGKPLSGTILGINGKSVTGCNTADGSNPTNNENYYKFAQYDTSNKLENCIVIFILDELPYKNK